MKRDPLIPVVVADVLVRLHSPRSIRCLVAMCTEPDRTWRPPALGVAAEVARQHVYEALRALEGAGAVEVADDGWRLSEAILGPTPELAPAGPVAASAGKREQGSRVTSRDAPAHPDQRPGESVDDFLRRRLAERSRNTGHGIRTPLHREPPPLRNSIHGPVQL